MVSRLLTLAVRFRFVGLVLVSLCSPLLSLLFLSPLYLLYVKSRPKVTFFWLFLTAKKEAASGPPFCFRVGSWAAPSSFGRVCWLILCPLLVFFGFLLWPLGLSFSLSTYYTCCSFKLLRFFVLILLLNYCSHWFFLVIEKVQLGFLSIKYVRSYFLL